MQNSHIQVLSHFFPKISDFFHRVLPVIFVIVFLLFLISMYFKGHSSSEFTLDKALSYYSIDCEDLYHVTACFSPRGKSLAGSFYHKSTAVERALGEISQLSILGWVITKDTLSARVSLTKEQQELWKNDHLHQDGLQQWKRGTLYKTSMMCGRSVCIVK